MSKLIDTHFHLDHYRNYWEIATRISDLNQYTICVTDSPGTFLSCKKVIPETKYLKYSIGFHPLNERLGRADLNEFLLLLKKTNYVGEIGLDYSRKAHLSRDTQIHNFETIVERCVSENKLMSVHIRNAEVDAIEVIRKYAPQKCIIHWFTGTEKQMFELLEYGCYFSVNSNMIASKTNSKYLKIPSDRILVESDGPYTKIKGNRFTPDYLQQSYGLISSFLGLPDLATIVYSNFRSILER